MGNFPALKLIISVDVLPGALQQLPCGICGVGQGLQYASDTSTEGCVIRWRWRTVSCFRARINRRGILKSDAYNSASVHSRWPLQAHRLRQHVYQHTGVLPGVSAQTGTYGPLHVRRCDGSKTKHPGLEFPTELRHSPTVAELESVGKVNKEPPKKRDTASTAASSVSSAVRMPASPAAIADGDVKVICKVKLVTHMHCLYIC